MLLCYLFISVSQRKCICTGHPSHRTLSVLLSNQIILFRNFVNLKNMIVSWKSGFNLPHTMDPIIWVWIWVNTTSSLNNSKFCCIGLGLSWILWHFNLLAILELPKTLNTLNKNWYTACKQHTKYHSVYQYLCKYECLLSMSLSISKIVVSIFMFTFLFSLQMTI